jgi:hypothetical protein
MASPRQTAGEVEFFPGQWVRTVVVVGTLGFARVPVDADADQVAGDRIGARVAQETAHGQPVAAAVVVEAGGIVLD